ncbi:hypothetical protein [Streptomyces sp. IB2014 016-6]|uniref:hypothetical protein n=1 Tax=Streptomyces sp. IB2014 016-6 TaxID=2517818 RepID=UPI0016508918|nr:hypothetical protein [Streptomyces sp. IB2014 016-6]
MSYASRVSRTAHGAGRPHEPPRDFAYCYHSTLMAAFAAALADARLAAVQEGVA